MKVLLAVVARGGLLIVVVALLARNVSPSTYSIKNRVYELLPSSYDNLQIMLKSNDKDLVNFNTKI